MTQNTTRTREKGNQTL